jgi:hypothetical protein
MKVFVRGQGEVTLTQQHFVATGGQASVYVRSGVAYKVYTDPKTTIAEDKFKALAAITDPCVIRPSQLLLDSKKNPVGYTMDAVADNVSLCQLFTKAFRDRNHVTNDQIVNVAAKLRFHVSNVHAAGVVIVDLNELNVLVSQAFDEAFLIDVDSYQTDGYPATVIMPSVRDWSAKKFTELSDWFSYAVVAFQLFVGSHPYKGTHPASASIDKEKRLEHRMRHNISAFRSDVSLPKCCYPFDVIPQTFRDWLKAVLDDGKRIAPPDPKGGPVAALVTQVRVLASTGKLTIVQYMSYEGWEVAGWAESGGKNVALVRRGADVLVLLNGATLPGIRGKTTVHATLARGQTLLGFTPKYEKPVALNLHEGLLTFVDLEEGIAEPLGMRADELNRSGDRFYIRNGTRVLEIDFYEVVRSKVTVLASHSVADVLEMASRLYEGCAVQNMLGSVFVSLFPRHRAGYQVRVPELDAYKIVDAKFDGGVFMAVGAKGGKYDRLIFRFDDELATYDVRTVMDITPAGLNFTTLPTLICVALTEDETIEGFSARKGAVGIRVVEDSALGNDMRLTKVGGKVGFTRGDKVYQVSLK